MITWSTTRQAECRRKFRWFKPKEHWLNFVKVALKQTLINKSPKDWNDYNNRKHYQQNREAVKLLTQI